MPNAIDRQFDDVVRSISFCHTDLLSRELLLTVGNPQPLSIHRSGHTISGYGT
jgi:hypothetical protein